MRVKLTEEMRIKLTADERQIVAKQCQMCQLWYDVLGCKFYPLTPTFEDNHPVRNCVQLEDNRIR